MNPSEDQFDEYRLPGDEPVKKQKFVHEYPDTAEYMMKQAGHKTLHEYYSEGGYQYGKRKKKK